MLKTSKQKALVLILVVFVAGFLVSQLLYTPDDRTNLNELRQTENENLQSGEVASNYITVKDLDAVTFVVPSDWSVSTYYDEEDNQVVINSGEGVELTSPRYATMEVSGVGMGGVTVEGIKSGALLTVEAKPNTTLDVQNAKDFFELSKLIQGDSANIIESEEIQLLGQPAILSVYRDSDNTLGGFANVGVFVDGEIVSVNLKYGVDETFDNYRDILSEIIASVTRK